MKIAYIINHKGETGVNNVVFDLITEFKRNGHSCTVLYLKETDKAIIFPCDEFKISKYPKSIFLEYDIVHLHGLGPCLYAFFNKPLKSKAKIITTFHNYVFQDYVDLYGKIKGYLLALMHLLTSIRIDKIIVLSIDAQNYYKKWISSDKITYAYNTRVLDKTLDLSPNEKKEIIDFKQNNTLIGMNGVLIPRKGIETMINAIKLLPNDFKIVFVGGTLKQINIYKSLLDKKTNHRVLFAGMHPKAYRYLPYYDIFALPSRSEGFPLALLEAASYGCNIVCTDLPILKECFTEEDVHFCQIDNPKSLTNAILNAKKHNKGDKAKQKFEKEYSPSCFYKKHLSIYKDLLNKHR